MKVIYSLIFLLVGAIDFQYTLAKGKEPIEEGVQNGENERRK